MYHTRSNENATFTCFNDEVFIDAFFHQPSYNGKIIDPYFQKSASYSIIENRILKFTKTSPNEV